MPAEPNGITSEEGVSLLRRGLEGTSTVLAGVGGLAIFGAAAAVTWSVIASHIGLGAIRGEFELVELACTACASLFLPLCQFNKGHVMVDVFTSWMRLPTTRTIDAFWTLVFALAWALLCARLYHGMQEAIYYGDRTMLLRAPLWWAYVPAILGTGLSAVVALYQAVSGLAAARPERGQ